MGGHVRALFGFLGIRIYHRGRDVWIGTKFRDDPKARKALEAKAEVIAERLAAGVALHRAILDVLGDCPPRLLPRSEKGKRNRLRDFYEGWAPSQQPPLLRVTEARKRKLYFERVILPELGGYTFDAIDKPVLEGFRQRLLKENIGTKEQPRTRAVKTVANIIGGHLRALWRDAEEEGLAPGFPSLKWPRAKKDAPDPFEPEERDRIIGWFATNQAWLEPWVAFLFWTGLRPGEAAALRWTHVDLERGALLIPRSRVEKVEEMPKTEGSHREIPLLAPALHALGRLTRKIPFDGDEHVFKTPEGKGMTDSWWPKRGAARRPKNDKERGVWWRCLRALGIRPRRSYCTRHTFIAWALSNGMNQKALAEYCGNSSAMIEKHYAKFIGGDPIGALVQALADTGKFPVNSPSIRRKYAKGSLSNGSVKTGK